MCARDQKTKTVVTPGQKRHRVGEKCSNRRSNLEVGFKLDKRKQIQKSAGGVPPEPPVKRESQRQVMFHKRGDGRY